MNLTTKGFGPAISTTIYPSARLNVSKFSHKPHIPSKGHYLLSRWYFVDFSDFFAFLELFCAFYCFLNAFF